MSFYSFIRTGFKLTLIAVLTLGMVLFFQNCSTQFSSGSPEAQASLNTPNRVIDDGDGAGTGAGLDTSELKIELYATAALQEDCSVSGENYQFEILNAPQDITMCTEYVLDMPEGYPIQQESYSCNDINVNDKFVPPSSKWSYSVSERKWSFRTMANSIEQMPGDYRLYVRSGSSVAKSALLKVRRSGYANCGSQTARYAVPQPPSSGGGGGVQTPTPSPSPSPGQVTPGANGACNPPGTTLVRVETELPVKAFPRMIYENVVSPTTIYSFAFKTTASSEPYLGALTEVKLTNTVGNKLVVVSECIGDVSRVGKDKGCSNYAAEASTVTYLVNRNNYRPDRFCNLKPNTRYYANVVSPGPVTTGQIVTCTSVTDCGFYFSAQ